MSRRVSVASRDEVLESSGALAGSGSDSWEGSWRSAALLLALGGAVALRVAMAGQLGAQSSPAAIAFSCLLLAAAIGLRRDGSGELWRGRSIRSSMIVGLAGFAILVAGPLATSGLHPGGRPHVGSAGIWAATVVLVAVSEEVLLRGALFSSISDVGGPLVALVVTSLVFALIHVPFYGWKVMPLDLAVGVWLGGMRLWTGNAGAPAIAHALADIGSLWV